jgi:hypothetical protein
VFAIGVPIEIEVAPGGTSLVVDQIVVSVGPYMFVTCRTPAASSSAASEAGKASPPIIQWSMRERTPRVSGSVSSMRA